MLSCRNTPCYLMRCCRVPRVWELRPGLRAGVRPDENPSSILPGHERGATPFYRRGCSLRDDCSELFRLARKKRKSSQILVLPGDCFGGLEAQSKSARHHRNDVGKFPFFAAGCARTELV